MSSGSTLQGALKLAPRPSQTISKKGEEFELNVKGSLLYLQKCTDCHAKIVEKATKVVLEDCHNLVVDVKSPLLSGTLEIISSTNIVLNLLEDGKIPTITADSTSELTINMLQHSQFGTLYLHQSSDIEIGILGDNSVKHKVCFPADDPQHFQYVVHWEKQEDAQVIVCEKVVREGVYPTTERKLKEDTERRERNLVKMAEALADCITIAPKPAAKPKDKPSDKVPSGTSSDKS